MLQAAPGGAQRLLASAAERPDALALIWQGGECSYGVLANRVRRGAGALHGLGVGVGDRVGLVLGNVPAFAEAWFATLHLGAVAVPLNPALAPDEMRHALDDAGVTIVVAGSAVVDAILTVAHEISGLQGVVVVGHDQPAGSAGRWSDLLEAAEPGPLHDAASGDLATIVYTSGTTGRPKGAMLTHGQLAANQEQSLAGRVKIEPDDRVLLVLPVSHIYALNVGLAATLGAGAAVVLEERFDPTSTLDVVARTGVTVLLGAPPMYAAWLALDDAAPRLAGLRVAVSGAAALPSRVFDSFRELTGMPIIEGYGLTEAGPSVTSNAMAPAPRAGSVGMPLPDIEVRLVRDGHDVNEGDAGELLVRGPNVFAGYWKDAVATAAALDNDGWLHTGDVAVRDADGYLHLVDRLRDLIIVSGFNVYPREVERVLLRHPGVAEVAVVGVPHPYTGEAVKAHVVLGRDGVTAEELDAHCRAFLARYKCPDTIAMVEALPHTATGKVRRSALRQAD